jgi:aminopeptidase N
MIRRLFFLLFILRVSVLNAQDEDDLLNKAVLQFSLQDFIGSIETCNKLIEINPKNGKAYYYKSLSKLFLGDQRGADADMELASANSSRPKDKGLKIVTSGDERRKYMIDYFYKKEKLYPELGYRPRYTRKDSLRGALRPERNCFDVTFYNLKLKIDPRKKSIAGSNDISFRVVTPTRRIQIDLFGIYKIETITWNDKPLTYNWEYNALFIDFPQELSAGTIQTIRVMYSGKPPKAPNPPWDGGFVWKKDDKGNYWCGAACERFGASSWWPCKDHPSDEPDSSLLTFIVPSGYDLISNGRLRKKETVDENFTSHSWFVANPINSYNVTFYLGKFLHFSDTMINQKGKYPLDYYVLPDHYEDAQKTFSQVKDVLKFYDQAFSDFPFMKDKYSLIESPYEGMEHQSAIAYGNEYNKLAKDQMYLNKKYDYIIVHESAHEWWGNSVSARDMADIWIQEGFATYAEMMFIEHKFGYKEYLKEMKREMERIFNIWPVVQNYDVNENAFASNDCYMKGATILHNLRCSMENDSLFFRIIKDFCVKNEKKVVTTTDFISMVNEYTGKDYTSFFKKYLYDKNLPVLKYSYKRQGNDIVLKYQWDEVDKDFTMPFGIALNKGKSMRLVATTEPQETVLKDTKTFYFYTFWIDPDNVERNSFTYYWTKGVDYK